MKRFSRLVVFVIVCAVAAVAHAQSKPDQGQPAKGAVTVAGKWTMTLELSMGTASPTLELKQDGTKITGTYTGRFGVFPLAGTLKERSIIFSIAMNADGQEVTLSFQGEVAADGLSMKGTASLGEMGDATWTAKKQ